MQHQVLQPMYPEHVLGEIVEVGVHDPVTESEADVKAQRATCTRPEAGLATASNATPKQKGPGRKGDQHRRRELPR